MRLRTSVYIDVDDSATGCCGIACPYMEKQGREYRCALFDLTKLQVAQTAPLRCTPCRDGEVK